MGKPTMTAAPAARPRLTGEALQTWRETASDPAAVEWRGRRLAAATAHPDAQRLRELFVAQRRAVDLADEFLARHRESCRCKLCVYATGAMPGLRDDLQVIRYLGQMFCDTNECEIPAADEGEPAPLPAAARSTWAGKGKAR